MVAKVISRYAVVILRFLGTHPLVTGCFVLLSLFGFFLSLYSYNRDRNDAFETSVQVNIIDKKVDDIAVSISNSNTRQLSENPNSEHNYFGIQAEIDDPDGYTNVRSLPSIHGEIMDKVYNGEVFYTHFQKDNWWQVRTPRNKIGYMHVSRIKVRE